jgi:hypothetical protein
MNRPSDRDLMRAYDGELAPAEEQRIARLLAEDPGSQRILGGLELVGEAVRAWADAKSGPADGIADRVMAAVAAADVPKRRSARQRWVVGSVAGALAIAAGVALAIGLRSPGGAPGWAEQASVETDSLLSADIEAVDFGGQPGSVFLVQADDNAPTPVVWLEDPEADRDAEECDTETL